VVTLSAREPCAEIIDDGVLNAGEDQISDRVFIDITLGAQPGPGGGIPAGRPMTAFQFSLSWDVDVLDVYGKSIFFLSSAAGMVLPISNIGFLPDTLSPYTLLVNDSGPAETGPGVLARLTLAGDAAGTATFTLTNVKIQDGLNETVPVTTVNSARLAVSKDLDGDGTLELMGDLGAELFTCEDGDADGVSYEAEDPCGSDDLNAAVRPERLDLAGDDDGDGMFDEALPGPVSDGFDCDGDGWTGAEEMSLYAAGTTANDQDACGGNGWPADLDPDNVLGIGDFNSFMFPLRINGTFNKFSHPVPDPDDANIERWNLAGGGMIDIGDLNAISPAVTASAARPPMLGGTPAFGQACPWPP
jgi:hypothetical protein